MLKNISKTFKAFIFLVPCFLYLSCTTPGKSLFGKSTPHEAYSNKLSSAGLNNTALGILWMNAAQKALQQPVSIQLPYKEAGYFAAEKPYAAGYIFNVKRGQKINISIVKNSTASYLLFADLWLADSIKPRLLQSADTLNLTIEQDADENADYQLRIQPELLKSGAYTLTVTATGSLAFPVPSENNPRVGSFWGASRDNGARSHEGIDIFGKFRTPVIAAADGIITSVRENNLGGKVIFLKPDNKNYNLYYAHLDSQIAKEGQSVQTGDVIGLMGNTGNAKYTATHLHFGIYTFAGAIDPYPFVDHSNTKPKEITASLNAPGNFIRATKTATVFSEASAKSKSIEKINAGTVLYATAVEDSWYKIILPGGNEGFISSNNTSVAEKALRNYTTGTATLLFDDASTTASPKTLIAKGMQLDVYGSYNDFYFVEYDGLKGWIRKL